MLESTKQKHGEQLNIELNGQESENKSRSNYELLERIEIQGTPFTMVGSEEQGYFAAMQRYRITERHKTKEEVLNYIDTNMWKIIVNITIILTEGTIEMMKAKEQH